MSNQPVNPLSLQDLFSDCHSPGPDRVAILHRADPSSLQDFLSPLLESGEAQRVYRYRAQADVLSPWAPFLEWMLEAAGELSEARLNVLISEAEVYPLHRLLLARLLSGKKAERPEPLLPDESDYERKRWIASLVRLFRRLCLQPRSLCVVEGLEQLPLSSIELLDELARRKAQDPALILLCSCGSRILVNERYDQAWNAALEGLEAIATHLELDAQRLVSSRDIKRIRLKTDTQRTLKDVRLCLDLMAYEDCTRAFEGGELGTANTNGGREAKILMEISLAKGEQAFYCHEYDLALLHFQGLLGQACITEHPEIRETAAHLASYSLMYRSSFERARKLAALSLSLAQELGDQSRILRALAIKLLIDDKENRMDTREWTSAYRRILELAERLKARNALAFWLARPDRLDPEKHSQEIEGFLKRSIQISKFFGNNFRLASAYHAMGLFHIYMNSYETVDAYYKKSELLTRRLGNTQHLAQIQNGYGYFCHQNGRYEQAARYFLRAFSSACAARDLTEISMSICNAGINAMICRDFSLALRYFESLRRAMRCFGFSELPYHSRLGINTLICLSYYHMGMKTKFLEAYAVGERFSKEEHANARAQNYTEEALLGLLSGAYHGVITGKNEEAALLLRRGQLYFEQNRDMIKYLGCFFFWESSLASAQLGMDAEAEASYQRAAQEARALANLGYDNLCRANHSRQAYEARIPLAVRGGIDLARLSELGSISRSLELLHRKVAELDFLNIVQGIIRETSDLIPLIQGCARAILASFPADILICRLYQAEADTQSQLLYEILPTEGGALLVAAIRDYVSSLAFGADIYLEDGEDPGSGGNSLGLSSQLSISLKSPQGWVCHLFCATMRGNQALSGQDFSILSLMGKQILTAMEKLRQDREIQDKNRQLAEKNELLFHKATRDDLTGLHNRQYLMQRLEEEESLQRRARQEECEISLLFIDLDNFKYVNDNFGHALGDIVLVDFAKLLQETLREYDIAARIGGDEFMIFLPRTGAVGAALAAERILESLGSGARIQAILERELGRRVEIPSERIFGCSIGISYARGAFDKDSLIRNADDSLYRAKNEGKGCYRIHGS